MALFEPIFVLEAILAPGGAAATTANADRTTHDGWDAHRRDQLARTTSATPVQRLRWLEEAIAFAFRAGALPRQTIQTSTDPGSSPDEEQHVS